MALLTKLSGFAKFLFPSLGSDRTSTIQKVVSQRLAFLSDHSKWLTSLQTLPFFSAEKMSVSDYRKKNVCLFPIAAPNWTLNHWLDSADCLYGVGWSIDNFWLRPWIICKLPGPPGISYNLLKLYRKLFLRGTKNEFGCPADFCPDKDPWIRRNPLILSRTLSLDFVFRPPKISFTLYHRIQSMNSFLHSLNHYITY